MAQSNSFKGAVFTFLMMFGWICERCLTQDDSEAENKPAGDGGAFFALRSCHQLLTADKGEFFSPDYLCSNPPLWCNWTIQVDPGKRIHLHLEDLTAEDACHLKQDQIHVDEPTGLSGNHRFLQKCWRELKYTSTSNTVYVVLLIGGWPHVPYRGFYGRYQGFGPLVVYNPQEGVAEQSRKTSTGLVDFSETGPVVSNEEVDLDDYDDPAVTDEPDVLEDYDHGDSLTTAHWTSRRAGVSIPTPSAQPGPVTDTASPQQEHDGHKLKPPTDNPTPRRRNVEEAAARPEAVTRTWSWRGEEESAEPAPGDDVSQASNQNQSTSGRPELEEAEEVHPHPNMVELLSGHRRSPDVRNHSVNPHLPGDHLFEVAVEVQFSQDLQSSWDDQTSSLLLSLQSLIHKQLDALHTPLSMSSKRTKRLRAGVLYILWLQIGQMPGGPQDHRTVRPALEGLVTTVIRLRENQNKAVIISVSTADVNECGTQLVLCDVNADCVNHFGSYSCHCRLGFKDKSRLGSGGTFCAELKAAGCSSGPSPETKGVYVLFFLLSSFILMLLVVAGVLYHRYHRGAFLVRCSSSSSLPPPDLNNNNQHYHDDCYSCPAEANLPPPLPPARGPRGGWPHGKERCLAVDLPLLRFSSLVPPGGYREPQEGGKM